MVHISIIHAVHAGQTASATATLPLRIVVAATVSAPRAPMFFLFNSHLSHAQSPMRTDVILLLFRLLRAFVKWINFSKDRSLQHLVRVSIAEVVNQTRKKKKRHYDESYLKYGFTVIDNKPQCVICGDVLSRESMKPSKLMRHLTTRHQKEADKSLDFFERKLKALSQQQNTIIQVSNKILFS